MASGRLLDEGYSYEHLAVEWQRRVKQARADRIDPELLRERLVADFGTPPYAFLAQGDDYVDERDIFTGVALTFSDDALERRGGIHPASKNFPLAEWVDDVGREFTHARAAFASTQARDVGGRTAVAFWGRARRTGDTDAPRDSDTHPRRGRLRLYATQTDDEIEVDVVAVLFRPRGRTCTLIARPPTER